jgi:hypothetical protein
VSALLLLKGKDRQPILKVWLQPGTTLGILINGKGIFYGIHFSFLHLGWLDVLLSKASLIPVRMVAIFLPQENDILHIDVKCSEGRRVGG